MSDTIRAVVLTGHGDLDKPVYRENWPKPVPGPGAALAATFPLERLREAQAAFIAKRHVGNIVVTP